MLYGIHYATLAIMALNVLVSLKGFSDSAFFERYKFSVGGINAGQKDRMISSGFLHVDMQHLLFNMITLYFFADVVIGAFGPLKFLIIYMISLSTGSLLAQFFHKNEPQYSAVGASGAVMGVLYSAILLQPFMQFYGIIPAYIFGIGYLLFTIYGMKKSIGNIGHTAHFGGAIGGYATTLFFDSDLLFTSTLFVVLLAIPIIILFVMAKLGKI